MYIKQCQFLKCLKNQNIKMNKNVLILGSSSDIGKSVVKCFINDGYTVYLHYNKTKPKHSSKNVKYLKCNLNKIQNYKLFIKKIKNVTFSSFINLIGYIDNKEIINANYKNLENSLRINFIFPVLISNYISLKMVKNNFGRILHCSSIGVKFGGGKNTYTYSLAKHCLEFIPQHYKKISNKNVLYNVLRIGVTDTKIHKKISKKNLKSRIAKIPIGRIGQPEEIGNYIYFLSSKKNTFITNQILSISGGE